MPINTYEIAKDENGHWIQRADGKWLREISAVGKMRLFKWEQEMFILGKARGSRRHCCLCENEIKSGCYFYGSRRAYYRVCIKCYPKFVENFIKSLEEHKKMAKEIIKEFKVKEGDMIKNNLVSSL
jgi:hypothetical protein